MAQQVIAEMLGKVFTSVVRNEDEVVFTAADGSGFRLFHEQDCCEGVWLEDVCGDLDDLANTPLMEATVDRADYFPGRTDDYGEWTFYNFRTHKGHVQLRWCGESNGYYSTSVGVEEILPNGKRRIVVYQ